jgi:HK97 family phage portal protein
MNLKFLSMFGNRVSQKSIPQNSGMYLESYVTAPLPLKNNPVDLINMNLGYVYICNKINSQTVASCKFKLFTTKGKSTKALGDWVQTKQIKTKEMDWIKYNSHNYKVKSADTMFEIIDHPFLDLLYSVSTFLDNFTLFEITESYLGLIGNAYWYIIKDNDGMPSEIEVLPAEYISVLLDKEGHVTGYRELIEGTGVKRDFKIDEVLHFKQPVAGAFRRINYNLNTVVGIYGMGSLESCIAEAQLLESINTYERKLMDNSGKPDFVVKYTQGTLEDATQKKLVRQWNQIFRGSRNAGKIAVMDSSFDIVNLGFSPKDLAYQEGKKYLRTTISNAFGVHENFISVENANRASSETAIEQYYRFTILPKLRRMQEVINAGLVAMYDDNLFIAYDDPVPENFDAQLKQEANDINLGIISINEARLERGLALWESEYDRPLNIKNPVIENATIPKDEAAVGE